MNLAGKNVFITGSTRGIGQAIAQAFAKAGANIVLNGRSEITSDKIEAIKSYGVQCIGISGDISDYESAGKMLQQMMDELGSIDILINNAGITKDQLLLRMSAEDFDTCIKVNLNGTFNMTQHAIKKMMKQRSGCIINMASVTGLIGNVGQANYSASKAGVVGFTKSVAREVAARGITCNAIAPGFIETEMTEVLSDKVKEQMKNQIPLKLFGQVQDVAGAAIFLAKSPYITGQVINVDGGLVMNG
ncbi:3-oxoacyl-(acyl-carrier-protein) reductase FabG [Melissococcus plutonius]|uniref:3-oxoacyl-[acyl-carrier-protein] reductase n=1 Tax=Melissococcus plutonius TaxID=33970 RepID=UPI00065E958E|nr:3-oxoacyl-[acyl-carrier-protein] reductase [Melissococcus plutonius]AIM24624.1 3-oxoacyl-(acyl-carrier-protein) reductase FabG [Melissococcus plutonius S1]KMT24714.1 3-oxoacyl-(acyl-carrier-protein) reductase FabG [Melissococcus plutonius]KMT26351.1 3-oxoacyl-(acyl-carrier-protein) reductase FabG [Melissococcus plutonius]KMT27601.1 3-oxoacyl-(acyl-carrier-protein) reductase FabG [Melissococcus plutonius]KMT29374.1 3-oxoacyl-(acyl-carrier-protein) reductase FabG [Melissococcus plutonius]